MVNGGLSFDPSRALVDRSCTLPPLAVVMKNQEFTMRGKCEAGASRRQLFYRVAIRSNSSSTAACLARGSG
jgi:hypothetical protein